ncbi:hypothetical protein [Bradyrhizobium lablabi]|uniref:hypothetical protein n=1 Tax=Bradyrhizobium lablabi TaxID=722472 RepID=UPI0009A6929B|nr:hypothetical protein [Bradyrhizobium lablabi]
MRKFVRVALIACLVVAPVPSALFAALWFWTWSKNSQVESFYREHPLLSEMRARQPSGTNDSPPARQALLEIVPLGTNREAAVAALGKEGFVCQTVVEPVADTRLRQRFLEARGLTNIPNNNRTKDLLECLAGAPAFVAYTTWITYLEFDADGRLSEARVATWTIFI